MATPLPTLNEPEAINIPVTGMDNTELETFAITYVCGCLAKKTKISECKFCTYI